MASVKIEGIQIRVLGLSEEGAKKAVFRFEIGEHIIHQHMLLSHTEIVNSRERVQIWVPNYSKTLNSTEEQNG